MFGLEEELQDERNTALAIICAILRDNPDFEARYVTTDEEKRILAEYHRYLSMRGK